MSYQPVTTEIVEQLKNIVGPRYVLFDDADALQPYSHDEIPDPKYAAMPECVVRPESAGQIADILKLANRRSVPVTPRGAGSGLSGGAVPVHGGIVLLCDRMNRILEIDADNMMAVVEPGVVTSDINEALSGTGLFYAGYPMSLETCTIGGNVAENAGGGKAVKYGVTNRYVLGLEVVTPTGDIVEIGGKLLKDVTGYNLAQLMIGSEGTLCVFTKVILKLIPLPRASVDLLCLFPTVAEAIRSVPKLMTESGVTPTAIEFIDAVAMRSACEYLNETLPYADAGAMLLITVDGSDQAQVTNEYETIGEQCLSAGAIEVYVADNHTTSERIWNVRRNIAESFAIVSPHQANEDLVVPPAAIAELVLGMQRLAEKYDIAFPAFGHAGDGNLHVRLVKKPDWTMDRWRKTLPKALDELYDLTVELGGRISGEHGIGHKRKAEMSRFVSPTYLELCRTIKRALDPNTILNPGKIMD